MKQHGRYCVSYVTGYTGFGDSFGPVYENAFFDSYEEAVIFRGEKWSKGIETTKVMDLENLPF